jgi:tetratricopeptide (TPR) repeat protein
MAEQVQSILDGMVPALADWKARGLFDDTEIRMIVQRRRESEYKIQKRNPQLKDFLKYLEMETKLHELFTLRYRKWKREQKKKDSQAPKSSQQHQPATTTTTTSMGEFHSLQFVHNLWERTLRKFRQIDLFLEYAAFCQATQSWKKLSHVYTRAMRFFPHHVPFYIEAASFEYFQRHNLTAARVLLQRGLRFNSIATATAAAASDLWWQSFTLEMHFVQKMMGRRQILLASHPQNEEEQQQQPDTTPSKESEDRYAIARLVLDHAMASPADSLPFRLQFLEICRSFPKTESLMAHIQSTIQRDYNTVDAWMVRVKYIQQQRQHTSKDSDDDDDDDSSTSKEEHDDDEVSSDSDQSSMEEKHDAKNGKQLQIQNSNAVETVLDVIRQACRALPTPEMWERALEFLNEMVQTNKYDDEAAWKLLRELLEHEIVTHSPQLMLWYSKFKIRVDEDRKAAIQILRNFVETQDPVPAEISIQLAGLLYADSDVNEAFQVFETALAKIPMHDSDYMTVLLQYFSARLQARKDRIMELFQKITLLAPGFRQFQSIPDAPFVLVTSIPKACWHYLLFSLEQGMESFRKSYQIVLYQSNLADQLIQMDAETMIDFVDKAVEEELRGESMDTNQKKRVQRLFETAIHLFRGTPEASEYRKQRDDFLYNANR